MYQAAAKLTEKISTNVSLKDVKVGDTVELLIKNSGKEENTYQYLGKYFFLRADQQEDNTLTGRRYYAGNGHYIFNKSQVERYLLKNVRTGKYEAFSTPKVLSIVSAIDKPLDKMEVAKEVTAWLGRENNISEISNLILISPTKIKLDTVTSQLVPLDEKIESTWPVVDSYYADAIVSEFDNRFWLGSGERVYDRTTSAYHNDPRLTQIELALDKNELKVMKMAVWGGSRYSNYPQYQDIIRLDFTFDQIKMYRIEVTANGITGKVYRLRY